MTTAVIRYLGETCGGVNGKCADYCECLDGHCENDYKTRPMCPRNSDEAAALRKRLVSTSAGKEKAISSAGKGKTSAVNKAYEQIYGDDYVQQRGVGGYIPMYDAPYHYEHVQPVYQPQLASSTNPDSMQFGLMLLGLGLFLCLAICIVFVLLSAVCFVVGRFSNAKKSDKIEYEELAV
eukprot:1061027_1